MAATALGNITASTTVYKSSEVDSLINAVNAKLVSAMHYKGTVASISNLPVPTVDAEGNSTVVVEVGDVWNCTDTGKNYAASAVTAATDASTPGSVTWDELTGIVDLSAYTTTANLGDLALKDAAAISDVTGLQSALDAKATASDLDAVEGRLTTMSAVTVPTKATVTIYELYDFVKGIFDALKDAAE